MDEAVLKGLCMTYMGMSAEEIAAAITSSKHAAAVPDPAAVAALIFDACQEE